MEFKTTSLYQRNFLKLVKTFPEIDKDICAEFRGLTFEEVFNKKYVLKDSGDHKILKIRIANSQQNKGKSGGFRLIAILNRQKKLIVFLTIYSKVGSDRKDNIPKTVLKEYIDLFKKEVKTNTLVEFSLSD